MSKLVWDAAGTRTFETGVSHGVLYPRASDGTYETGVVWNGLTSVSESPEGAEATDLWADDMKYASFRSAETFGATIEAYTYPDEWADCDGSATAAERYGQQQIAQEHDKDTRGDHTAESPAVGGDTTDDRQEIDEHQERGIDGGCGSCGKAEVGLQEEREDGEHGVITKAFARVGKCQGP